MPPSRIRRGLGSGWLPAVLVYAAAAWLAHDLTLVSLRDLLSFTAWVAWGHTLPGTVLWRALDPREDAADDGSTGRPFVEDVVLGTLLGVVAATPTYLACVALGVPLLVLAWPLLVLVPALLLPRGRSLLRRRQPEPTPTAWSWTVAAVMLLAVLVSAQLVWPYLALTTDSFSQAYVDEPFHLALVGELRHHAPPEFPYVAGTPLSYHWMFYPVAAMATWGSTAEAIVVLRVLAPMALTLLLVLGVAVAAARLSARRWAAPVAALALVAVAPLDAMGWTPPGSPWIGPTWFSYRSPTQTLVNALAPLLIVVVADLLTRRRPRPHHWLLAGAVMLSVAWAKSTMLPLLIAGLLGTLLVMLVVRRSAALRVLALGGLAVAVLALATWLFYGAGARSLTLDPFQYVLSQAETRGLVPPDAEPATRVSVGLVLAYVVCVSAPALAAVGLFVRGGWRTPLPWVLVGSWAAGVTAVMTLGHPALGQGYFYRSGLAFAAVLVAVGLVRLVPPPASARGVLVLAAGALAGVGLTLLVPALNDSQTPDLSGSTPDAVAALVDGFAVPLGLLVLAAAVVALLLHRLGGRPVAAVAVLAVTLAGAGIPSALTTLVDGSPEREEPRTVPADGIEAARWLREHSSPDERVATNIHTRDPRRGEDHRSFWVSAWSERRVLVEGWAYIPLASVGLPSGGGNEETVGPSRFWDPEALAAGDSAISDPTPERLALLRERYDVRWLFVDTRRDADLDGLRALAQERHQAGDFVVLDLGR